MKTFIVASLIAASTAASALEIGVAQSLNNDAQSERYVSGVTVGAQGVTVGYERFKQSNTNRWSLTKATPIAKFGSTEVAVKAGGQYIQRDTDAGYALVGGVGVAFPLNKQVSLTADYRYALTQDRVNDFRGSSVAVGIKVGF